MLSTAKPPASCNHFAYIDLKIKINNVNMAWRMSSSRLKGRKWHCSSENDRHKTGQAFPKDGNNVVFNVVVQGVLNKLRDLNDSYLE